MVDSLVTRFVRLRHQLIEIHHMTRHQIERQEFVERSIINSDIVERISDKSGSIEVRVNTVDGMLWELTHHDQDHPFYFNAKGYLMQDIAEWVSGSNEKVDKEPFIEMEI